MKEYKVVRYKPKAFFVKFEENLEIFLNQYAKAGWKLKETNANFTYHILEREKNR